MLIEISQFINPYDILFIIFCIVSIFFGIKNGLTKSLLNLLKWIIIFYLIKNCFVILRPIADIYITNQTISDILIFFFTIISSYIFISFINRVIIGVIQPKRSGLADIGFGAVLGLLRGYIIFVLMIFFIDINIFLEFLDDGSFKDVVDYGVDLLIQIPRNFEEYDSLGI